jgi:antirestriction protein ArdC
LKTLQNDKRLILKAATQAQAAADYILNIHSDSIPESIEKEDQILS